MENKISKSIIFFAVFIFSVAAFFLKITIPAIITLGIIVIGLNLSKIFSKRFALILMIIFAFGTIYSDYKTPKGDELQRYIYKNCNVSGVVASIPKYDGKKVKFYLNVNKIGSTQKDFGMTIVSIYSKKPPKVEISDVFTIEGEFLAPSHASNWGQFDYADYLKKQGVFTVIYPQKYKKIGESKILSFRVQKYFTNLASAILEKHTKYLNKNQSDLLGGIVFGHSSINISEEIKQNFINSGTFHILAASGMQIALVLLFWCYFLRLLKIPSNISFISGGIIIIFYACFTGFPASILRALLMAEFIILGKLIDRQADNIALLLLVCSIMLLYSPLYILDVGFQLSFLTTFGLVFALPKFLEKFKKFPDWISGNILVTVIAQIFALPVSIFYFNNLPLYSFFANVLIVPFVSVVTFAGFVSGMLSLIPNTGFITMLFCKVLAFFLNCINFISSYFSHVPNALIFIKQIDIFSVLLLYIFAIFLILLLEKGFSQKVYASICIVSLSVFLLINVDFNDAKNISLTFFNVGNSDAILIKLPNKKQFLVDTGRSSPYGSSCGKTIINEYLKSEGNTKLEAIILTHFDSDHIGGCKDILEFAKVKKIYVPLSSKNTDTTKELRKCIIKNKICVEQLPQNYCLSLYSDKDTKIKLYAPRGQGPNSNSLITYIEKGKFSALLMGDNEKSVKGLNSLSIRNSIDVMKLGHHGSKNSIDEKMLQRLNPQNIVISVGKNNYHHPDFRILALLKKHQVKTYKTREENMIVFSSDGNTIEVKKYYPLKKTIE